MKRHVPVKGHVGVYWSENQTYGKRYEIRYRTSDGHDTFKIIGPDLQDALNAQADIRVRIGKGERVVSTGKTFGEVAREWESYRLGKGTSLSANTVRIYKQNLDNHIMPEFEHHKVGKISADMIHLWLRDLTLSGSTRQTIYIVLRGVLGFAANPRRGYISHNPCDQLEKGELPRPDRFPVRILMEGEAQALLAAVPEWHRSVFQTAMLSGLRINEVLGLDWQDVDFQEDLIHVRAQLDRAGKTRVPPKGGKTRDVILVPALRQILFSSPTRFAGGYVFTDSLGNPKTYPVLRSVFQRARVKAKLSEFPRPIRIHDLRHTFASALLQDGKDVVWVSRMLGHANPNITLNTYAHVIHRENRVEEASVRLEKALGGWAR